MKRPNKQAGVSIVSLLVGVLVSAGLLLAVGQLAFVSKHNYTQAKNIIELNQNGQDAIEFLRKNIEMAGMGIAQPVPAGSVQLDSSGRFPAYPAAGGYAVLPNWTAIGNFADWSVGGVSNYFLFPYDSNAQICADYIDGNFTDDSQFFSLWACGQCFMADPNGAPVDKSQFAYTSSDNLATCCQPSSSGCGSDANYCETPNYNCGGIYQAAIYQKLRMPVCFGIGCTGADPLANANGDILTVYFANPGTSTLTSFSGQNIPANTLVPAPHLYSYSFYVDANTSTLLAGDALQDTGSGIPNTNIASNIEYMAVMLGESDLSSSINATYSAPQTNRYVRPDTANLYPYRVSAVRVAVVVRSTDQVLDAVPANTNITLMMGNDGNPFIYTAPADQYLRKVFTTTIYLKNYTLPVYQTHCANVGGSYYLKTGGIPFSDTWTTNDQCCGGGACSTFDWNTCETNRMNGNC